MVLLCECEPLMLSLGMVGTNYGISREEDSFNYGV